jgi:hypothetical protein
MKTICKIKKETQITARRTFFTRVASVVNSSSNEMVFQPREKPMGAGTTKCHTHYYPLDTGFCGGDMLACIY